MWKWGKSDFYTKRDILKEKICSFYSLKNIQYSIQRFFINHRSQKYNLIAKQLGSIPASKIKNS